MSFYRNVFKNEMKNNTKKYKIATLKKLNEINSVKFRRTSYQTIYAMRELKMKRGKLFESVGSLFKAID